jgi:hypothetical protein
MIYTSKNCGKNCFGNNRIAVSRAERAACDSEAFELRRPLDPSRTCSSITSTQSFKNRNLLVRVLRVLKVRFRV